MLSIKSVFLAVHVVLLATAAPISRRSALRIREVPQEHSHEPFLTSVQASLVKNNPNEIQDAVFGLLGDAAAAAGAGKITDLDCLQAATADQAFTNAKADGDVQGMVDALTYRALERNTGAVGEASAACTSFTFANPEIAAVTQHQDPASTNAAATNKAIVLALAQQIASVGGDPQDALKSGTFAPGTIGDPTAAGNTCDDANDANGCIFTQNLLVDDATADEIDAAVTGIIASSGASATAATSSAAAATVTAATAATTAAVDTAATSSANLAATTAAATSGTNLQEFTGGLGGITAPAVTAGGRGFVVAGETGDSFLNVAAAIQRSCSIQHNACSDAVNSGQITGSSVSACDTQNSQCVAAN